MNDKLTISNLINKTESGLHNLITLGEDISTEHIYMYVPVD